MVLLVGSRRAQYGKGLQKYGRTRRESIEGPTCTDDRDAQSRLPWDYVELDDNNAALESRVQLFESSWNGSLCTLFLNEIQHRLSTSLSSFIVSPIFIALSLPSRLFLLFSKKFVFMPWNQRQADESGREYPSGSEYSYQASSERIRFASFSVQPHIQDRQGTKVKDRICVKTKSLQR